MISLRHDYQLIQLTGFIINPFLFTTFIKDHVKDSRLLHFLNTNNRNNRHVRKRNRNSKVSSLNKDFLIYLPHILL